MKMKHPESKQTIEVREDMVDVYLSQGWESVEKPVKGKDD